MPATISVLPVALPLLHQSWASLPAGEEKKKKKGFPHLLSGTPDELCYQWHLVYCQLYTASVTIDKQKWKNPDL